MEDLIPGRAPSHDLVYNYSGSRFGGVRRCFVLLFSGSYSCSFKRFCSLIGV
jgi:hypothetical protein